MKGRFETGEIERLVELTLRKDAPEDYERLLAERRKMDPDAIDVHLVWQSLESGSLKIKGMGDLGDGTSEISFTCKIYMETEFMSSTGKYICSGKLRTDASGALKSIRWELFERESPPEGNLTISLEQDEVWGMQQRMIDPTTGKDVTGEALAEAQREYEVDLEQVIREAVDRMARGALKMEVWAETEKRIKELQQKLWDSHKGGWLQDWLRPWDPEDRFTQDLKRARQRLHPDEP